MPRFSLILSISVILAIFGGKSSVAKDDPGKDAGIHIIGDGNICVYGQNSTITQLFGAPCSSPSVFHLVLSGNKHDKSERIPETAIWKHQIINKEVVISTQTDFISSQARTFMCITNSTAEVTYELTFNGESSGKMSDADIIVRTEKVMRPADEITQSYLVEVGKGIPLMFSYLTPRGRY